MMKNKTYGINTSKRVEAPIPIDSTLNRFALHLKSHPRTILSAKYGDGKTYFLNEFAKLVDQFQVIRISPVNYQVVDNSDVFELIKWDLIFQLTAKGMLSYNVKNVGKWDAFKYCIGEHGMSLLEKAAEVSSKIPIPDLKVWGGLAKATVSLTKEFVEARKAYKKHLEEGDDVLASALDQIKTIPAIENDLLTKLINESIRIWKEEHPGTPIVLVFDDMDRLDPAHLFRILNIISAHMDYGYQFGYTETTELESCKFGVDNIVVVLDYQNLESIFHHFYGEKTSMEGYIRKFADKGRFDYSVSEEAQNYFYKQLSEMTQIDESFIRIVIPEEEIKDTSIRVLTSSFDNIESQLVIPSEYDDINMGIVRLIAVLKRLGKDFNWINDHLNAIFDTDTDSFVKYTGLIINRLKLGRTVITTGKVNKDRVTEVYEPTINHSSGFADAKCYWYMHKCERTKIDRLVVALYSYVG